MKLRIQCIGLISAFALAAAAFGEQPPDVVTSDASGNTAMGTGALLDLASSFGGDTAAGSGASYENTSGSDNTAFGHQALYTNKSGNNNTALGTKALWSTQNDGNVAIGFEAGYSLVDGFDNVYIANTGEARESDVMRLGQNQTATYIAGIYGAQLGNTPTPVYINSVGQLGTVQSSERFKTAIQPMGPASAGLQRLRPVSFHLKFDPQGPLQYGLIAEEVARLYPELVVRDQAGRIDGVRYDELASMLLNELQKQHAVIAAQNRRIADQNRKIDAETAEFRDLKRQMAELKQVNDAMQAALPRLDASNQRVAMQ